MTDSQLTSLSNIEKVILLSVLQDVCEFSQREEYPMWLAKKDVHKWKQQVYRARNDGCRVEYRRWGLFGDSGAPMRCSRALKKLIDKGLLEGDGPGRQVNDVFLTPLGRGVAEALSVQNEKQEATNAN